ncbi:nuclear transport factor 2 family protein [Nocardioides speluncae]|uniref:nuclear transport factor 2 family protein n=1 Tax=Nocardioides speluncae TaxID=2670337 RepID=UPI000D688970|nr:nuclear transport factor 2 family protein [Nocardioides speluncae]
MGQWSRTELEDAFGHYQHVVAGCCKTGDWKPFAEMFAADGVYVEHAYGTFTGPAEIYPWIAETMGTFPGNEMVAFPPSWHSVDEEKGWVICDIRNLMRDPGDGTVFEASNLTVLRYAGDRLWAGEEDAYNPANFLTMVKAYLRHSAKLDTLSAEARTWAETMKISLEPRP